MTTKGLSGVASPPLLTEFWPTQLEQEGKTIEHGNRFHNVILLPILDLRNHQLIRVLGNLVLGKPLGATLTDRTGGHDKYVDRIHEVQRDVLRDSFKQSTLLVGGNIRVPMLRHFLRASAPQRS